jgi:hypothetical protein
MGVLALLGCLSFIKKIKIFCSIPDFSYFCRQKPTSSPEMKFFKEHRTLIIIILAILALWALVTWYDTAGYKENSELPTDSVYDEMMEHEHVFPNFPKKTKHPVRQQPD